MSANNCVRCSQPIPPGKEVWMRRKNKERISLCAQCAGEVRQTKKVKQAQRKPARLSSPARPPRAEPVSAAAPISSPTVPIEGILILIVATMVGSLLLGAIVALAGRFFIVFPILTGIAGGFIMGQGVRFGKVREPMVAAAFGLVLGLIVYGSYRYAEYRFIRIELENSIIAAMEGDAEGPDAEEPQVESEESDPAVKSISLDEMLLEETGQTGFIGVMLLNAKRGMSIERRYGSPTSIGTVLTWVYWLVELVIAAGIPTYMAMVETRNPFCEQHDRWFERERSLGNIDSDRAQEMVALLNSGDRISFGKSLDPKPIVPGVQFCVEYCVGCQENSIVLTMKSVKRSSLGIVDYSVMGKQTVTMYEYEQIQHGVRARGELGY